MQIEMMSSTLKSTKIGSQHYTHHRTYSYPLSHTPHQGRAYFPSGPSPAPDSVPIQGGCQDMCPDTPSKHRHPSRHESISSRQCGGGHAIWFPEKQFGRVMGTSVPQWPSCRILSTASRSTVPKSKYEYYG